MKRSYSLLLKVSNFFRISIKEEIDLRNLGEFLVYPKKRLRLNEKGQYWRGG